MRIEYILTMSVIEKDEYRVDQDFQRLLRALYHKHHATADDDETSDARPWMTTSELAEEIDAENTYRVRYRVQEHLEPAGLVRTVQTPRDDGGDGTYRYRITTYCMQWIDDEHPEVAQYPPDEYEKMDAKEVARRNAERIAVLSDGDLSGQDIDTVLSRMEKIARRMDNLTIRLKELGELETRLATVEDQLDRLLGWDDSLDPVDRGEFDAAVEELATELGRIKGVTDREIGEAVRRAIDRSRD